MPGLHAQAESCYRRAAPETCPEKCTQEGDMLELRLELQPYYDDREARNQRRVQRGSATSRSTGWSSSSSHSDQREVAFRGPALPRRSATLEEDTFEFGAVRVTEIEL